VASSLTIDVAEATRLTLLCVMKASSPIDGNVTFATVQTCCTLHATTRADAAKLEKSIEDWAIISDIELALFFRVALHIVWSDFLKKLNVFIRVKLGHLMFIGRLGSL
jgi:hypothetical protein